MATTPYFLWPAQASSATAASDAIAAFEFSVPEETAALAATTAAMDMAPLHAPELYEVVARFGSGRQQGSGSGGGTPKKPPQRGLGVAELERLRCGGVDPLQDLNVAATTALLEAAAAAAASAQGNSVLLHHQHDHLPAFDAATGVRYYLPLLVHPPPAPLAPQAPVRFVHGMAPLHAPELHEAVARPRLRRQASSGLARQQGSGSGGGMPKKPPQCGLGVAELERLRCGGVDLRRALALVFIAALLWWQGRSHVVQTRQDISPNKVNFSLSLCPAWPRSSSCRGLEKPLLCNLPRWME